MSTTFTFWGPLTGSVGIGIGESEWKVRDKYDGKLSLHGQFIYLSKDTFLSFIKIYVDCSKGVGNILVFGSLLFTKVAFIWSEWHKTVIKKVTVILWNGIRKSKITVVYFNTSKNVIYTRDDKAEFSAMIKNDKEIWNLLEIVKHLILTVQLLHFAVKYDLKSNQYSMPIIYLVTI